jgi:hypothetical protein
MLDVPTTSMLQTSRHERCWHRLIPPTLWQQASLSIVRSVLIQKHSSCTKRWCGNVLGLHSSQVLPAHASLGTAAASIVDGTCYQILGVDRMGWHCYLGTRIHPRNQCWPGTPGPDHTDAMQLLYVLHADVGTLLSNLFIRPA